MADLLCLDDWPEQTQEAASEQHQSQSIPATGWEVVLAEAIQQPSSQQDPNESNNINAFPGQEQTEQETSSAGNWELVLAESTTQPIQQTQKINFSLDNLYDQSAPLSQQYTTTPENYRLLQLEPDTSNTFDPFSEPEQLNGQEMKPRQGWELALADTAAQPSQQQPEFMISSVENNTYSQPATSSTNTYNPFLEEPGELAYNAYSENLEPGFGANDTFSAVPTFQATTQTYTSPAFQAAFSTQNLDANDPFSDQQASKQMFKGSLNQQNLVHQQQLWLQQQNEIIAKHMA